MGGTPPGGIGVPRERVLRHRYKGEHPWERFASSGWTWPRARSRRMAPRPTDHWSSGASCHVRNCFGSAWCRDRRRNRRIIRGGESGGRRGAGEAPEPDQPTDLPETFFSPTSGIDTKSSSPETAIEDRYMPNWCYNRLTVSGETGDLEASRRQSPAPRLPWTSRPFCQCRPSCAMWPAEAGRATMRGRPCSAGMNAAALTGHSSSAAV